jgi:hypothetical protein
VITLRTESIATHWSSERVGLDKADVGSVQATVILRRDLRAVACVWARFAADKSLPLDVKTYAWLLRESSTRLSLERIDWTDEEDPSRVDLTSSHSFKKSKAAVAFSHDLEHIWTAGGVYKLQTGSRRPPPALFQQPDMSGLTLSRNASIIAGVRADSGLEVYDIPKFRMIASASGDCTVLGVSPYGKFVLFLRTFEGPNNQGNDSSAILE